MHRLGPLHAIVTIVLAGGAGGALAFGCSATDEHDVDSGGSSLSSTSTGSSTNTGGSTSESTASASTASGEAGGLVFSDAGGPDDAGIDGSINPCGSECGPTELCDIDHLGLDDDCDGLVDEGCSCNSGQAHFCFKGDPSYHNTPGCFDGTEKCTELGTWGPCIGGVHATDNCSTGDATQCHPIQAVPFEDVNLKDGTGQFSDTAVPGTEVWTVKCPVDVNPCPAVTGANPPDDFKPLQSGEYTITYTKGLEDGGTDTCTYPLFVGAPGLRVELTWEHDLGGTGVDLDLHVHQPNNTQPWGISPGVPQDCTWSNCQFQHFSSPTGSSPHWFNDANTVPDPVNWYEDPVFVKNTCYFSPRGVGEKWQMLGKGCHNPRLDLDNVSCDPEVSDPNDTSFCAPENINIDFPPNRQWIRIGVHYFGSHSVSYAVHPSLKIYCDGALSADLGPSGYDSPVTFTPQDGSHSSTGNKFWLAADVAFTEGTCGTKGCIVQPLYINSTGQIPLYVVASNALSIFGPPYPPLP